MSCALESDKQEISLLRSGQVQTRTCQSGERFIDGLTKESVKCTPTPGVVVIGRPHRKIFNCSGTIKMKNIGNLNALHMAYAIYFLTELSLKEHIVTKSIPYDQNKRLGGT